MREGDGVTDRQEIEQPQSDGKPLEGVGVSATIQEAPQRASGDRGARVDGSGVTVADAGAVISDEIVQAYDDGEALGMVTNRRLSGWPLRAAAISTGLTAVVPLIRAQVAADVLREAAEAYAKHWRSAAGVGWAVDLPSAQAGVVSWLENRAAEIDRATALEPDEPVADVKAAFEAGEKGVTRRPLSNREFIDAEVERLGLQPQVDAMWAELENGPPMPPRWCTWHQMADCAGDAPECREARAEIDEGTSHAR